MTQQTQNDFVWKYVDILRKFNEELNKEVNGLIKDNVALCNRISELKDAADPL